MELGPKNLLLSKSLVSSVNSEVLSSKGLLRITWFAISATKRFFPIKLSGGKIMITIYCDSGRIASEMKLTLFKI